MRRAATALFAMALLAVAATTADAHPLHTTLAEVTTDASRRSIRVMVRVFTDDFGRAAARGRASGMTRADGFAYVQRSFTLVDGAGRPLALRDCGVKRTADLSWVCVEAALPQGIAAVKVRNSMLSELYEDQVNIVRVNLGGAVRSLLFTKGASAKPIG